MEYAFAERKAKELEDKRQLRYQRECLVNKLYHTSHSFAEFKVKMALNGIKFGNMRNAYWHYYMQNNYGWRYWVCMTAVLVVATVATYAMVWVAADWFITVGWLRGLIKGISPIFIGGFAVTLFCTFKNFVPDFCSAKRTYHEDD